MPRTYGYIRTDTGELIAYHPPRPSAAATLRKACRVIASLTPRLFLPAALVVILAVLAATPTTLAAPPHATATRTHIVVCNWYLSHAAMVAAQEVGPPPAPAFCFAARS